MRQILLLFTIFLPISISVKFHHFRPTWATPDLSIDRHKRDTIDVSLIQDDHDYYLSTFDPNGFDTTWMEVSDSVGYHTELSQGYYLYSPVDLGFKFPFYGHYIQDVALTTHGFLSTADIYHSQIHLTQYIAPFSADFNPRLSPSSQIYYVSYSNLFIAQWSDLFLTSNIGAGKFTFQVQLRPSGEIKFVYKSVPLNLEQTTKRTYPSFSGLSDGYIVNVSNKIFLYSYHDVSLSGRDLEGGVYTLTPLPNCVTASNQTECNTTSCGSDFNCGWCQSLGLCSDGLDRRRQSWVEAGCHQDAIVACPSSQTQRQNSSATYVAIIIIGLLFLFVAPITVIIVVLICWCLWYKARYGKFIFLGPKVTSEKPSSGESIVLREPEDAT